MVVFVHGQTTPLAQDWSEVEGHGEGKLIAPWQPRNSQEGTGDKTYSNPLNFKVISGNPMMKLSTLKSSHLSKELQAARSSAYEPVQGILPGSTVESHLFSKNGTLF